MGDSPSPLSLLNYKSNPHAHKSSISDLLVCWYNHRRRQLSPPPTPTATFFFLYFILCGPLNSPFFVSSQPLLNTTHSLHQKSPNSKFKLILILSLIALFTLIILMAFLKFFRFRLRRRNRVSDRTEKDSGSKSGKNEKIDWDVIQKATMDFSSSQIIGSGGFSTVYLARFVGSTGSGYAAVKIQCSSERLDQVYKQELQILLNLHHSNIVKLIGFCDDRDEGVLVFEYIPNGTLQDKLHGGGVAAENSSVLTWRRRMAVAFQLAEAIEYLHEKCSLHIVHGDIKSSNILLDDDLNCKLCDFGSAKMGFSSTVLPSSPSKMNRMILGSQGYIDPHYLRTGIASKKNDVYSFGVILLELITGREAFCPETGEKLTSVVSSVLHDENKVMEIFDSKLMVNSDFDLEEAKVMAKLSSRCLSNSPSLRVSASEILTTMKEKISSISFLGNEKRNEICLNVI